MNSEEDPDKKLTQNVMVIPDRYVKEVYSNTPLDQFRKKLFAPERGKQRVVNFVGYKSEVSTAMKMFQDKIDRGQDERKEWLRLNGTEKDIKEIQQQIALEKSRTHSTVNINRLEQELAIVKERVANLQKTESDHMM